jgi:hypothetical protein
MSDENVDVREFGPANKVNADEVFRTIVGQMFENDNDQSELELTLQGTDGTESVIKFDLIIKSINGVETRSGKSKS